MKLFLEAALRKGNRRYIHACIVRAIIYHASSVMVSLNVQRTHRRREIGDKTQNI